MTCYTTHSTLRGTFEKIRSRCSRVVASDKGDSFEARCPGHDDKNPSFGARLTDDRILLNCQAGCDVHRLCAVLDVPETDLFLPDGADDVESTMIWHGPDGHRDQRRIDRANGTKEIRWADAGGIPTKRLLYFAQPGGWPLDSGAKHVVVAEGAKAADAIFKATGLPTIGIPNASVLTDEETWQWAGLAGRSVALWPDFDPQGYQAMFNVSAMLRDFPTTQVRFIDPMSLPGIPKPIPAHWDAADYEGWPENAREALKIAVCEHLPEFPDLTPDPPPDDAPEGDSDDLDLDVIAPLLRDCSTKIEPTPWLWRDRIPAGVLFTLTGAPDAGKSLVGVSIVAHLSSTAALPGEPEDSERKPLKCAWVGAEDEDAHETVVSRLNAAGADGDYVRVFKTPEDRLHIARICRAMAKWTPDIVFVDSHVSWFEESIDGQAVRTELKEAFRPLLDAGAAVGIVSHWRKSKVEDGPDHDRTAGASSGLIGGMRAALEVRKVDGSGVVRCTKHNLGPQPDDVEFDFGSVDGVGVVQWGECVEPEPEPDTGGGRGIDDLLATLDADPNHVWTKNQLLKALGSEGGAAQRALAKAIDMATNRGLIETYTATVRGQSRDAYRRAT